MVSLDDALSAVAKQPASVGPSSKSGTVAASTASKLAPAVTSAVEQVATNPYVPKVGSVVGQVVGGIQGAMRSPLDAAGGAWAGGKAGWFTGKLLQKLAAPAATALEAIAPLLEPLGYGPALQGIVNVPGISDIPIRDFLKLPQAEQQKRLSDAGFAPQHASWVSMKLKTLGL